MPQLTISALDVVVFIVFVLTVVSVGLIKSRGEVGTEGYFLAGRGLKWWLIGFSLLAANISSEQFVGMSGNAASHVGLAIASFEWMASVTLVVVAFGFLPYFLRAGIYTMPEFLEYRYSRGARTLMAAATLFIYMLLLGAVTYSGALTLSSLAAMAGYNVSIALSSFVIALVAMLYVAAGGLKACAWADLIQGSALIVGGGVILYFAFAKLGAATEAATVANMATLEIAVRPLDAGAGALERFWTLNKDRLNMFLPGSDPIVPWTALLFGLWIPHFYYWGLNQYITQRTLGSASLAQGQKGIVFAAFLKLLTPFVIVIPGIIAFNLYSESMRHAATRDNALVLARYLKANPSTRLVETLESPPPESLAARSAGRYVLALYPDQKSLRAARAGNFYVYPILASEFAGVAAGEFPIFVSDDRAWHALNPSLSAEMAAHNAGIEAAARAAGRSPVAHKLIAYKYDTALAQLLGNVLPPGFGLFGFVIAALLGAVVSTLAAMLNAASTIFSIDLFKQFVAPSATHQTIVLLGRIMVVVFSVVAVAVAPALGNPQISNSIFMIIQEGQGFISSGIVSIFAFGLLVRRAPPMCGIAGLLTNIVAYGALMLAVPGLQFLNRMAVCFALCVAVLVLITALRPLPNPITFQTSTTIDLRESVGAKIAAGGVVLLALLLYVLFSPIGLLR